MAQINSCQRRWSVGPCACSKDTILFSYGNATLHILADDLRDLGTAMQRMADELKAIPVDHTDSKKEKELLQ